MSMHNFSLIGSVVLIWFNSKISIHPNVHIYNINWIKVKYANITFSITFIIML